MMQKLKLTKNVCEVRKNHMASVCFYVIFTDRSSERPDLRRD